MFSGIQPQLQKPNASKSSECLNCVPNWKRSPVKGAICRHPGLRLSHVDAFQHEAILNLGGHWRRGKNRTNTEPAEPV